MPDGFRFQNEPLGAVRDPYIHVMDYEVRADGSTDDSTGLQNAFTAVTDATGGTLVFPEGLTFICKQLSLDASGVRPFIIEGNGSTLKAPTTLGDSQRILINTNTTSFTDTDIVIRDLTFDGNGAGNGVSPRTRTSALVILSRVTGLLLENCRFTNVGYIGINAGSREAILQSCKFDNCGWSGIGGSNNGPACWIATAAGTGENNPRDVTLLGCEFYDNFWIGLHFSVVRGIISNSKFRNNQEAHIFCSNTVPAPVEDITIHGNVFDTVLLNDIASSAIELSARRFRVSDNIIRGSERGGIALTKCQTGVVSGNVIGNCGTTSNNSYCIQIIANGTDGAGTQSKNTIISGNVFYDDQATATTDGGITIFGAGDDVKDMLIEGNVFSDELVGSSGVFKILGRWVPENDCRVVNNVGLNTGLTIASAGTINLTNDAVSLDLQVLLVTGSTTINNITNGFKGQRLSILWDTGATFDVKNENGGTGQIHLSQGVDASAHADEPLAVATDTLELVNDGTDWNEVSRSDNT